ncbi:MAG: LAGLIDADG family homing endonuclease [Candidatus Bathycorpusculaceae bacterium]
MDVWKLGGVFRKNFRGEDERLEYIAGFLDGDGCFSIRLRRYPGRKFGFYFIPLIVAANSHKKVITFVHKVLKVGYIGYQWYKWKGRRRKLWLWKNESAEGGVKVTSLLKDKLLVNRRRCYIVKSTAEILRKHELCKEDVLSLLRLYYSINPTKNPEKKRRKIAEVLKQVNEEEFTPYTMAYSTEARKKLSINYVAGFFDAEGCFYVQVIDRGDRLQSYPAIAVGNSNKDVISKLRVFFKCGRIACERYGWNKKQWFFRAEKLEDCEKITRLLDGRLIAKSREIQMFKKAIQIFKNKEHLTTEGLSKVTDIANRLHPNKHSQSKDKRRLLLAKFISSSLESS